MEAQCKSGTIVWTRCLVYCQRNTETNQENKPTSSRFDVTKSSDVLSSVLCVSSTWLVKRKRKKSVACLQTFVFFPSLKLTFVSIFSYWTSIFSMTKMFSILLKRFQKCFSNCYFVWHSVVGGHIMVCMAQQLELLVRTYKRLSSFEHATFY